MAGDRDVAASTRASRSRSGSTRRRRSGSNDDPAVGVDYDNDSGHAHHHHHVHKHDAHARSSAAVASSWPQPDSDTAAAAPHSSSSSLTDEMRCVEAILAGRTEVPGQTSALPPAASATTMTATHDRDWGYWLAVIVAEVLLYLWVRWAMQMYAQMRGVTSVTQQRVA